jgi:hypothetical protein
VLLQEREVDRLVFDAIEVIKPKLRHPTLKWHLTTFEVCFAFVARARLGAFVATGSGAAAARTGTPAKAF